MLKQNNGTQQQQQYPAVREGHCGTGHSSFGHCCLLIQSNMKWKQYSS